MKRRNFVKSLGLAAIGAPIALNHFKAQAMETVFGVSDFRDEGRVLVIIRLNGGNDGLNTVIPLDQYANLTIQRPNIIIPQSSVLGLTTEVGLHPAMSGMKNMFDDGKLNIIQNVGYPEQNRSHFRSMDIWNSGLIDAEASTGWLGRNFLLDHPFYPDGYPNVFCLLRVN